MSLFDKYGGREFWVDTVDIFYERLLADPQLAPYFVNHDVSRVKALNSYLLEGTLGFPNDHFAVGVQTAHRKMSVTRKHFYRYLEVLKGVLRDKEMCEEDLEEVQRLMVNFESEVVNES